jgi:flagellar biosynthesis/type III secretory pathway protein FliH
MGRIVRGPGHVVPAEVLDAKQQARALLDAARAQADRIRGEAEAACEEARRQGHAQGQDAAAAEALAVVVAARAEAAQAMTAAKPAALALAAKMAAKIVGRAVDLSPAVLADIAGEALRASRARPGRVVLRVNPADHATLLNAKPELHARLTAGAELELVEDAAVTRHGCIVETAAGRLDARLETQLAVLEKALRGERPHG